ncbi:18833_t:CDS:2, partial [Dentiscutata erythropus]
MSSGDNKIIEELVQNSEKVTPTNIGQENEILQQNLDNLSPKQTSTNCVIQISTDPKPEWNNEQMEYNLTRKFSMAEEDVCFPIKTNNKHEGIDYDELEKYTSEINSTEKEESQCLSLLSPSSGNPLTRRVSQFSERTKSAEITEEYRYIFYSSLIGTIRAKTFTDIVKNLPDKIGNVSSKGTTMSELLKKGYFWIDVLAPTESEMRMLSK